MLNLLDAARQAMVSCTSVSQFNQKIIFFMNSLSFHLAWRYLTHTHNNASIKYMIRMCFMGIMIGTCALMLTLIITNGFEAVISEKIRGINAPLTICSPGRRLHEASIKAVLMKDFGHDIAGISGSSLKQVFIDHADTQTMIMLRGITPADEASVSSLPEKIVQPREPLRQNQCVHFTELLKPGNMVIGYKLAHNVRLNIGDSCTVLLPKPRNKKQVKLVSRTVTISGFFNVGLEEYDSNMAFINHDTVDEWFNEEGVDQLAIALRASDHATEQRCLKQFQKRLPQLTVVRWQEQYPALVASLKLEKYVMFFVLALITLVACMNMISLLFMQIQHKRRDIALFKAIGMQPLGIGKIFLWMGMLITISASLVGLGIAGAIGYMLQYHWQIPLPDVYFVSYLPARLDLPIFLVVFTTTLLLGLLATWLPLRNLKSLHVVEVLRNS